MMKFKHFEAVALDLKTNFRLATFQFEAPSGLSDASLKFHASEVLKDKLNDPRAYIASITRILPAAY